MTASFSIGERVKHSARFLRSIGNGGNWRGEVVGTVSEILHSAVRCPKASDWVLILVEWDNGNGWSEVNAGNLVKLDDVAREARRVENEGLPGVLIGTGNAFARFDADTHRQRALPPPPY